MTDQLNSSSSGSAADEGCACPHPEGAHYAAFGCYYCECPYVPPLPAKEETPPRNRCGAFGTTTGRVCILEADHEGDHDLSRSREEDLRLASQPSSSSEITEALNELEESAFDRGELRHGDPTEKAVWERARAARLRLESLYREQLQEIERREEALIMFREEQARDKASLSSLKDSQLTPEEAQWLSDLLRVWHYPDDRSDLAARLRAWGKAET